MKMVRLVVAVVLFLLSPAVWARAEPAKNLEGLWGYRLGAPLEQVNLTGFEEHADAQVTELVDYTQAYVLKVGGNKRVRAVLCLGFYQGTLQGITLWCVDLKSDLGGLESVQAAAAEWRLGFCIRPYDGALVVADDYSWDEYIGVTVLSDADGDELALAWERYELSLYLVTPNLAAAMDVALAAE